MTPTIGLLYAVIALLCVVTVALLNAHHSLWRLHRSIRKLAESQDLLREELHSAEKSLDDRIQLVSSEVSDVQLCVDLLPKVVFGDSEMPDRRRA